MPDEHRSIQPRRDPEDIDLAGIKTYLELLMEQIARADQKGASLQTALRDDRLCRARRRLVRDFSGGTASKPRLTPSAKGRSAGATGRKVQPFWNRSQLWCQYEVWVQFLD
jgi:hypothetical protein